MVKLFRNAKQTKRKGGELMSENTVPMYKKLRDYIAENDLQQKTIALNAGISESRLSYMLSGKRKLTVDDFIVICAAMGASPKKFLPA